MTERNDNLRPHIMLPSTKKIDFMFKIKEMGFEPQEKQNTIWLKGNVQLIVTNTRVTLTTWQVDPKSEDQTFDYSKEQQDMLFRKLQLDKLV